MMMQHPRTKELMQELDPVQREEAAMILDQAHDLMNDGGKHWNKGMMSSLIAGSRSFCMLGGISHVFDGLAHHYPGGRVSEADREVFTPALQLAYLTVADCCVDHWEARHDDISTPMPYDLQAWIQETEDAAAGRRDDPRYSLRDGVDWNLLGEVVYGFNDADETRWEDVSAVLREAARRIRS